jgi:hypothetical protein
MESPRAEHALGEYFLNAIKEHQKATKLYCETVTRHPSWSRGRVLPPVFNKIEEEEIAREFERLVHGHEDSTSSCDHFTEATNAYRIFFELTEKQKIDRCVTKPSVGQQKQLKT